MNTLNKKIWAISGPIMLSNITVPLVGAVDTIILGQLPNPALIAAVAVAGVLFSFIFWGFNSFQSGTSGLTAQALGASRFSAIYDYVTHGLFFASFIGLILIIFHRPIGDVGLMLINSPEDVRAQASIYYDIRIFSAPAQLINYVCMGLFIGMQQSKLVFWNQLLLNILNIILSLILVLGFDLSIAGVAWGTVIATIIATCVALFYALRLINQQSPDALRFRFKLSKHITHELFSVNINIMLRTLCLMFSISFFLNRSGQFGTTALAANAVLMQFVTIMAYALDGFAYSAESLGGNAFGKKDRHLLDKVVLYSSFWAFLFAIFFGIVYFIFGESMVNVFSINTDVREAAYQYLPWIIVFPAASVMSFQLDGLFIGTTQGRAMRNAMFFSTFCFILLSYLLMFFFDIHGLWLAFLGFNIIRAISLWYFMPVIYKHIEQ